MDYRFNTHTIILILTIILLPCVTGCGQKHTDQINRLLADKENFDTTMDGRKVELFTLRNKGGITVQLTNYGGYIVSVIAPDRDGRYADVVPGYRKIREYLNDGMMANCIVGPNAHIIAGGRFSVDGNHYQLPVRNGGNNVHSSPGGFNKRIFDARQEGNKVTMTLHAKDMENGFPGDRNVTAVYELLPGDTLSLEMTMTTDKKTIANMTNHAYFNLAGEGTNDLMDQLLQIFADSITPYHPDYIPTGELMPVAGSPFDLRQPLPIGRMIDSDNEQIRFGKGYDHNFVLSKKKHESGLAVRLSDNVSGRLLELFTNQPGIQVYTGNYLDGTIAGRSGKPYNYRSFIALEPQDYPDAPNHPNFPSSVLEPGKTYRNPIKYVFKVMK